VPIYGYGPIEIIPDPLHGKTYEGVEVPVWGPIVVGAGIYW
jgi:hypothetical protein